MAKTDDQELTFGNAVQFDPQYATIQRKKLLAQALQKQLLESKGDVKRHPLAIFADFMSARGAKKKSESAMQEESELLRRHQEAQAAGQQEVMAALQSGDPAAIQAALVKAMSSQYPGVNKLGTELYKGRNTTFKDTITPLANRLDPQSVLDSAGSANLGGVKPAAPLAPPRLASGVDGSGKPRSWLETVNNQGEWHANPLSDPTQINNNMGMQPGVKTLEKQGEYYAAGGEGFKLAQASHQKLNSTADLLRQLEKNPVMGAGANGFQIARSWLETLTGTPIEVTGDTAAMKQQLQRFVLTELGGKLGNQISNTDRDFMAEAIGQIDSNPAALRRLLIIGLKNEMMQLSTLSEQARKLEEAPAMKNMGIQFPGFMFGTPRPGENPNPELPKADADDLEMLFMNKLPPLRGLGQGSPAPVQRPSRVRPLKK